jgi:hypothetical protein
MPVTQMVVNQLHPDVYRYLDRVRRAGGAVADHKVDRINRFITQTKDAGINLYYTLFTNATRDFNGCNVPLYDSGVGNATLTGFTSAHWTSDGIQGANNRYVNTGFIPADKLPSLASSFGSWGTRNNTTVYEQEGIEYYDAGSVRSFAGTFYVGRYGSVGEFGFIQGLNSARYGVYEDCTPTTCIDPTGVLDGMWLMNFDGTTLTGKVNNSNSGWTVTTDSVGTFTAWPPGRSYFFSGINRFYAPSTFSPYCYVTGRWRGGFIGGALTDYQQTVIYSAFQQLVL